MTSSKTTKQGENSMLIGQVPLFFSLHFNETGRWLSLQVKPKGDPFYFIEMNSMSELQIHFQRKYFASMVENHEV